MICFTVYFFFTYTTTCVILIENLGITFTYVTFTYSNIMQQIYIFVLKMCLSEKQQDNFYLNIRTLEKEFLRNATYFSIVVHFVLNCNLPMPFFNVRFYVRSYTYVANIVVVGSVRPSLSLLLMLLFV